MYYQSPNKPNSLYSLFQRNTIIQKYSFIRPFPPHAAIRTAASVLPSNAAPADMLLHAIITTAIGVSEPPAWAAAGGIFRKSLKNINAKTEPGTFF